MIAHDSKIDDSKSAFAEFWKEFRLFPSPLQETIYSRPLFFIGIPLLPFIVLVVVAMIADVRYQTEWKWTLESLKEWQEITVAVGLALIAWAFSMWRQKIPSVFKWLYDDQRLASRDDNLGEEYLHFLNNYQELLFQRGGRYAFVFIFLLLVLAINLMAGKPHEIGDCFSIGTTDSRVDGVGLIIVWILGSSLWAVFAGFATWPFYATGRCISGLSEKFDINLHPSHPDNCGGLKRLGDFCFSMTLPIVIGGLFLALFGFGGTLLPEFAVGEVKFDEIMPQTAVIAGIGLIAVVLPSIAATFFLPLWNIHRYMVERKNEAEDEHSRVVMELQRELSSHIEHEGELDEARTTRERLEILHTIHPSATGYPVWPFERSVLLKLFSPQILGFAGSAVNVIQAVLAEVLQRWLYQG